jgi:thioredoxin 1
MAPSLERLEAAYTGRVDLWKLNADEQADLVRALGVRSIPTLIVFQGDEEITRRSGGSSPASLDKLFEAAVAGEAPARSGPAPSDRLLRSLVGVTLLALGGATGPSLLLAAMGGAILFSAVHDRCPLWQAFAPRLATLVRRGGQ